MAKLERRFSGDFNEVLAAIHEGILNGSMSASYEDGSFYSANGITCAVRVYERYSMFGGNRVSLNVTLVANGYDLFLSAITSGGSQAMFLKINTVGEEAFLECLERVLQNYLSRP